MIGDSMTFDRTRCAGVGFAVALMALAGGAAAQQAPYPTMAPREQYNSADEAALARSAAPASISGDAEIMVLGARGYESVAKGKNGFVCLVERSWANDLASPEFWNPKVRSPICFNPASARSVVPGYLKRTQWVLAGVAKPQIIERTKAAVAAHELGAPEAGAMAFMMSKEGYLGDDVGGHWRPHLMFFTPRTPAAAWGAGLPGVPLMGGDDGGLDPATVFFVPVDRWSDGAPVPAPMKM